LASATVYGIGCAFALTASVTGFTVSGFTASSNRTMIRALSPTPVAPCGGVTALTCSGTPSLVAPVVKPHPPAPFWNTPPMLRINADVWNP
jgi:hypothetical protein